MAEKEENDLGKIDRAGSSKLKGLLDDEDAADREIAEDATSIVEDTGRDVGDVLKDIHEEE